MARRNSKKTSLKEYLTDYNFTKTSNIRKEKGKIYLPNVYCHNGHRLITSEELFDGFKAIKILALQETGGRYIYYLSPIINDQRIIGPDLPDKTPLKLCCPTCHEELQPLIPCTCRPGAMRRALFLTPKGKKSSAVGICDTYGCPHSFVIDDGEIVYEVVEEDQ